ERLAVSRQPVLQALRLLKKDGVVLDAPGRGLLVAPLDPAWIAQLYQVRGALDALAARLAAGRRATIDPKLVEQGRKAARGRDLQAMIEADVAFHHAIYAASGNPLIEKSAEQHWIHLRRVMGAALQDARRRRPRGAPHRTARTAGEREPVEPPLGRPRPFCLKGPPCSSLPNRPPGSTATVISSSPASSARRKSRCSTRPCLPCTSAARSTTCARRTATP